MTVPFDIPFGRAPGEFPVLPSITGQEKLTLLYNNFQYVLNLGDLTSYIASRIGTVTTTGSVVAGHVVVFSGTSGTIVQDGGALALVATSGAYTDLSGRPSLATVATSGAYADLSGRPSLAAVATSGSATDLTAGTLPAARLPTSGVSAGTYGDATHIPVPVVDVTGRITSITTIAVAAGGTGTVTTSGTPTTGQIATFSGSTVIGGVTALPAANAPAFTGGDVTSSAASLVLTIANGAVTYAKVATAAIASAASDIWTNVASKLVSVNALWASQLPTALTDAATVAVDMNTGINFSVTLAGNRTLGAPTNAKSRQSGVIEITQDATGSRTLAFAAAWDFGPAGAPTLSTTAGKTDLISYYVLNTTGPVVRAFFGKAS